MKYSKKLIQQVKEVASMRAIAEAFGVEFTGDKALCPFHVEKTPSFSIKDNRFKCFGCGKSGDIFDFIKEKMRCDFTKAVRIACKKVGLKITNDGLARIDTGEILPEVNPESTEVRSEFTDAAREQMEKNVGEMGVFRPSDDLLEVYKDFFEALTLGKNGLWYLTKKRRLSERVVTDAQLRSIEDKDDARRVMRLLERKHPTERLIRSCLYNKDGRFIWYRMSIIIPYFADGVPVYFTNRFMSVDAIRKSLFMKGRPKEFYMTDPNKRTFADNEVFVFEGVLDALSYRDMIGKDNYIAVNGGITLNVLRRIREFTDAQITCIFDNDEAGKRAEEELFGEDDFVILKWGGILKQMRVDTEKFPIKDFNDLLVYSSMTPEERENSLVEDVDFDFNDSDTDEE